MNDKVFYLQRDKGRLKARADSNTVAEDERHPLLPTQIQHGGLSTKQLLLSFRQKEGRKKKDCHMVASLLCKRSVLLCDAQKQFNWACIKHLTRRLS